MLPYLEAVDELLILTQFHQRKGTKKISKKTTNIAPANKINQTSETNSDT